MTINNSCAVVGYDDYYPFGAIMPGRSQVSSSDNKYKFTSKERDTETGYDYFGARHYDSRIGRWLSVDPLADKYPGWSPYNYTLNNPLKYVNPDGNGPIFMGLYFAMNSGYIRPVENFSTSLKGIQFVASYEKYSKHLYEDAGGHTTIGIGHLVHLNGITDQDRMKYKDGWSKEEALEVFSQDIESKENDVKDLFSGKLMTQNQFDALVSLTYNTGKFNISTSKLFKELTGISPKLEKILDLWKQTSIRSSGKILKGLKDRRAKEAKIYSEGEYDNHE